MYPDPDPGSRIPTDQKLQKLQISNETYKTFEEFSLLDANFLCKKMVGYVSELLIWIRQTKKTRIPITTGTTEVYTFLKVQKVFKEKNRGSEKKIIFFIRIRII